MPRPSARWLKRRALLPEGGGAVAAVPGHIAGAAFSLVDSPGNSREKWLCAGSDLAQGEGRCVCPCVCAYLCVRARQGGCRSRAALLRALPGTCGHRARLQERGTAPGPARGVAAVSPPRSAVAAALSGNFVRCLCAQGAAAVAALLPAPTRRLPLGLFGFGVNIYLQRSRINHSCRGKLISGDLFP